MKPIEASNIRVSVTESNELSPQRRSLIVVVQHSFIISLQNCGNGVNNGRLFQYLNRNWRLN